MKTSNSTMNIIPAMVQFQILFAEVSLKKDGKNKHLGNSFVTFDNLLNTCRPLLSQCNLVVVQGLQGEELVTTIFHASGEWLQCSMPFHPMAGNKGTNALQDMGGGITYAKRYQFSAMLNISVDTDTDGATEEKKPAQVKQITKKAVNDAQFNSLVLWINDCSESEKENRIKKSLESYELNTIQIDTISAL
jgi:hypothetical protein